uniref:Uncharacterized protein n=1 Tax=Lepeophtheirus salmonis TaxID=72036 RepID=A0A0K2UA19_LEPSM
MIYPSISFSSIPTKSNSSSSSNACTLAKTFSVSAV